MDPASKSTKVSITILVYALLALSSAIGVLRTILSIYSSVLVANDLFLSIVLSATSIMLFGIGKSVSGGFAGSSSDKIGRKRVMYFGIIVTLIGVGVLFIKGTILLLPLGNLIIGSGQGIFLSAAAAYLGDVSLAFQRAYNLGKLELAVYGGSTLGAYLGGIGASTSILMPLSFSVIFTLVTFLLLILVKEVFQPRNKPQLTESSNLSKHSFFQKLRNPSLLLRNKTILSTYFCGISARSADTTLIVLLPITLLYVFHFEGTQLSIIVSAYTAGWAISLFFSGGISDRLGRRPQLILGLLLHSFFYATMAIVTNYYFLLITVFFAGMSVGSYYSVLPSITVDIAPGYYRGKLLGNFRFMQDTGFIWISVFIMVIGYFLSVSTTQYLQPLFRTTVFTVAGMLFVSAVFSYVWVRETHPVWLQLEGVKSHIDEVAKIIVETQKGVILLHDKNQLDINIYNGAKNHEQKADDILDQIRLESYKSMVRGKDISEFMSFSDTMDKAGGKVLRAYQRLLELSPDRIPLSLKELFVNQLKLILDEITQVIYTVKLLDEKFFEVRKESYIVSAIEEDLDKLYKIGWSELTRHADQLTAIEIIILKEAMENLERAANQINDATEDIRIITFKHTPK